MIYQPRDGQGYRLPNILLLPAANAKYHELTALTVAGTKIDAVDYDRVFSIVATKADVKLSLGTNTNGQLIVKDQLPHLFGVPANQSLQVKRAAGTPAAEATLVEYGQTTET